MRDLNIRNSILHLIMFWFCRLNILTSFSYIILLMFFLYHLFLFKDIIFCLLCILWFIIRFDSRLKNNRKTIHNSNLNSITMNLTTLIHAQMQEEIVTKEDPHNDYKEFVITIFFLKLYIKKNSIKQEGRQNSCNKNIHKILSDP